MVFQLQIKTIFFNETTLLPFFLKKCIDLYFSLLCSCLVSCQLLIHLEEAGHALALGHGAHVESVGLHHGTVVVLMGSSQLGRHGQFVVQVGQGGVGVECAGIQYGLCRLFNPLPLLGRPSVLATGSCCRLPLSSICIAFPACRKRLAVGLFHVVDEELGKIAGHNPAWPL